MENFGKFMTIILGLVFRPIVCGFVILKLWAWFVVPTFEMQPLRLVEAIGLMFLVNYLKTTHYKKENEDKFWKQFRRNLVFMILFAGFALFGGWIVSLFM